MDFDEVWVIPALPVHRELSGFADAKTRLLWLEKAFAGMARVKVLDWEVSQQKPTPAVDTLRRFRLAYPGLTPWLMLGADAWAGLESWREYPALQMLCNVAVFARQGMEKALPLGGWRQVDGPVSCVTPGHWCYIKVELPAISATQIRSTAEQGRSLIDLVPAAIRRDIEKKYAVTQE